MRDEQQSVQRPLAAQLLIVAFHAYSLVADNEACPGCPGQAPGRPWIAGVRCATVPAGRRPSGPGRLPPPLSALQVLAAMPMGCSWWAASAAASQSGMAGWSVAGGVPSSAALLRTFRMGWVLGAAELVSPATPGASGCGSCANCTRTRTARCSRSWPSKSSSLWTEGTALFFTTGASTSAGVHRYRNSGSAGGTAATAHSSHSPGPPLGAMPVQPAASVWSGRRRPWRLR